MKWGAITGTIEIDQEFAAHDPAHAIKESHFTTESPRTRNRSGFAFRNRVRSPIDRIAVVMISMLLLMSVPILTAHGWTSLGTLIAPFDPNAQNVIEGRLESPSLRHLMGTDELGRDILSRLLAAAWISVDVALVVVMFAACLGSIVGLISGYAGGTLDTILMRITEMFLAFPALILAIVIAASLGRGLGSMILALMLVFWPWYARLVRIQVLTLKEEEFVIAGRCIGAGRVRVLRTYLLPNVAPVLVIQLTLDIGFAILAASSLSFVGFGVQPPTAEWGSMIASARSYYQEAWWYFSFPGLCLACAVFSFNLVGDAVREGLDPKSRRGWR